MDHLKNVYHGRGSKLLRCDRCKIALKLCVCSFEPRIISQYKIIIISTELETLKPSNTARLIHNSFSNTHQIIWNRNAPDPMLLQIINNFHDFYPILLYPNDENERYEIEKIESNSKVNTLIILDGTWKETRRIYRKSPYLQQLISAKINFRKQSNYSLRENKENLLSTVESVIDFLKSYGEETNGDLLESYFNQFNENYWKSRRNIG